MCQIDQNTQDMLETTIKQFLDEGRMFTGYDVTIATRQREDIKMRHKDVGPAIHEIECLVDAQDWGHEYNGETVKWERSQLGMPGGKWAFVYHPEGVDPSTYQHRQSSSSPVQVPGDGAKWDAPGFNPPDAPSQSTLSYSNTPSDSGGKNENGSFSTDYRNRLLIRTAFLVEAGLLANNPVDVFCENGQVILTDPQNTPIYGNRPDSSQQVERNGDLRLSSQTLRKAELDVTGDFLIENEELTINNDIIKVVKVTQK